LHLLKIQVSLLYHKIWHPLIIVLK